MSIEFQIMTPKVFSEKKKLNMEITDQGLLA